MAGSMPTVTETTPYAHRLTVDSTPIRLCLSSVTQGLRETENCRSIVCPHSATMGLPIDQNTPPHEKKT